MFRSASARLCLLTKDPPWSHCLIWIMWKYFHILWKYFHMSWIYFHDNGRLYNVYLLVYTYTYIPKSYVCSQVDFLSHRNILIFHGFVLLYISCFHISGRFVLTNGSPGAIASDECGNIFIFRQRWD